MSEFERYTGPRRDSDPVLLKLADSAGDLLDYGAQRFFSSLAWVMTKGFDLGDKFGAFLDSKIPQRVQDSESVRVVNVIDEIQNSRDRAESAAKVMIKRADAERLDSSRDGKATINSINEFLRNQRQ